MVSRKLSRDFSYQGKDYAAGDTIEVPPAVADVLERAGIVGGGESNAPAPPVETTTAEPETETTDAPAAKPRRRRKTSKKTR